MSRQSRRTFTSYEGDFSVGNEVVFQLAPRTEDAESEAVSGEITDIDRRPVKMYRFRAKDIGGVATRSAFGYLRPESQSGDIIIRFGNEDE